MKPTPHQLVKRALWLAFQASRAVGMGFIHATQASQATEDSFFEKHKRSETSAYADYGLGRMMKIDIEADDEGNLIIRPETLRYDYQSWVSTYPTAKALIKATIKSFEA